MRALIFAADPRRPWLCQRTRRSLEAAGFSDVRELPDPPCPLEGPVLLIRAGTWLKQAERFLPPPPSTTGKPLVAFGSSGGGTYHGAWQEFFKKHGGEFSRATHLPPCVCEWYDAAAVEAGLLAARLAGLEGMSRPVPSRRLGLIPSRWRRMPHRLIHWNALDCGHDDNLRALEVVTSLQHGGAERIAWELHRLLPHCGVSSRLVVLGSPLRQELPRPAVMSDLSGLSREKRAVAMKEVALNFGADVLHGHLVDAEDTRNFSKILPVVLTIHNARQAWPEGLASLEKEDCALLLACAQMVERELKEVLPHIPIRTVWNGIDPGRFAARHGADSTTELKTLTLVCVANPRHQKRLHLLPAILKATQKELAHRDLQIPARLILAGEASPRSPQALECMEHMNTEANRLGVSDDITFTQGQRSVEEVLAEGDVMISCSAYEGLSLAHLEGLAAGLPLVATDAGGTAELAWRNPAVTLLPLDATPDEFARATVGAFLSKNEGRAAMERDFSATAMTRRTATLLHCAATQQVQGNTLWFVTNNLSTGGAQSSLKRLAKSFSAQGIAVRVALLQEHPEHPTPGRVELLDDSVPVFVPPPVGKSVDTAETVGLILAEMNAHPPRSACFWNAIPACKVLIADALWHVPVFDVSPGEMYYTSLERCFENPHPALPYRTAAQYGARLSEVIVKYTAEASQASSLLGTKVRAIPNGVALPPLPKRERDATSPLRIGTAARLSPQKRLEDLLRAFRLALPGLPACELLIAGEAETGSEDYAAALKASAENLPVRWLGELRGPALHDFHASLDLFAMISEPAGCPNASLEAMASGLPVVATDFGGVSEQVLDGVTGRLVPPRDAAAFATALAQLCHDADLRAAMGEAARKHVVGHFSLERMHAAYRAVLWDSSQVAESALAGGAFPMFSSLHPP